MAIHTRNIYESIALHDSVRPNIYNLTINERIDFAETKKTKFIYAIASDRINIYEKARKSGGIINKIINENFVIHEAAFPKVKVFDVADVLTLYEVVNQLIIGDELVMTELAVFQKVKSIHELLLIEEVLVVSGRYGHFATDVLNLVESVTNYVI